MSFSTLKKHIEKILAIALVLDLLVLSFVIFNMSHKFNEISSAQTTSEAMTKNQRDLFYYDEVLTMSARMGAFTGNRQWEERYDENALLLDQTLKELSELAPAEVSEKFLHKTDKANQKLIELEKSAFRFAEKKQFTKAQALLLSKEYSNYKAEYSEGLVAFNNEVGQYKTKLVKNTEEQIHSTRVNSLICILVILVMWSLTYSLLRQWKLDLEKLNSTLEDKVKERTVQLEHEKEYSIRAIKLASLGEMAGSIAHEINNPLSILTLKAHLIKTKLAASPIDKTAIENLVESLVSTIDRLGKIVKNIKSFVNMGQSDPFEKHNLLQLVRESLSLVDEKISKHDIQIKFLNLENVEFECKGTQIVQVIANLISNAVDAMEKNRNAWIEIRAELSESVCVYISDSGKGFSENAKAHLFEPLFTTKESEKGTGLGLSITKRIIEAHHGTITLKEDEPHTCFQITLPKTQPFAQTTKDAA